MSREATQARIREAKTTEELEVYRDQARVGQLRRTEVGASFSYDPGYVEGHSKDRLAAIAFSMPVRPEPYEIRGLNLHPFFAGLLPEGLRFRALVRGVKTSEDDLFSMLVAVGEETVGDIWVKRPGATSEERRLVVETGDLGNQSFADLLARSLDVESGADLVSIAGVQPKVSAAMISFPVRVKSRKREYIFKLSPAEFPRLVENEFFFMRLARAIGIETASVALLHDREGESALMVERFDRVPSASGTGGSLRRLHQEDACQLLEKYPADKYRISLGDIAEALDVCSAPLVAKLELLRLQAFSYLIANGDLHAKNISVRTKDGIVSLSPAYDLLCTLPYGDARLALKIEGRDDALRRRDFLAFGGRLEIPAPAIEKMLDKLIQGIGPRLESLHEIGLAQKKTRHMESTMGERLGKIAT